MSLAMRVRSASVVLLGFLTIAFAFRTADAQTIIDYAPVVSAADSVWGTEGVPLSFGVTAEDYNEEPISSLTAAGSAVDAGADFADTEGHTAGTLSWTPSFEQAGEYSVTFTASNSQSGSKTTIITIAPEASPDQAPVVVAPLAINGEEGGTLSFEVTASDPDSDPMEDLSADFSGLPVETDVSFITNEDNTAGTLHWNMGSDEAGSYDVTFTATANDLSGSATTHINVGPAGTNITGVLTWETHAGDEGDYVVVFEATDAGGTTSFPSTIHVVPPSLAPSPSAPLAPRVPGMIRVPSAPGGSLAPQAPQAPQKGPIISGPAGTTVTSGNTVTVQVSAATDNSPGAFSGVLRAPRISKAAGATQATTLTCDTSELPPGNGATFVVDNQPAISGPTSVTALPGEALSIVRPASDPDGDVIETFTADVSALPAANPGSFTVSGPNTAPSGTLTWTPRLVDVGTYVVRFEATNRLVGPSSTTITVTAAAPARIFVADPVKINIGSARSTNCVYLEPVGGSFNLSEVNLSTVRLSSIGTGAVTEIGLAPGKPAIIEDRDKNHIQDLTACFQKSDLNALFGLLTKKTIVTATLQGQTTSGAYFSGTFPIEVIANGPNVGSASIAPNPLNPQAKLSLNLGKGGWLKVTLYDMQGRLVRELANETSAMPGPREIIVDGKDSKGAALSSGVYYFRVESADGIHNGRLAIVR